MVSANSGRLFLLAIAQVPAIFVAACSDSDTGGDTTLSCQQRGSVLVPNTVVDQPWCGNGPYIVVKCDNGKQYSLECGLQGPPCECDCKVDDAIVQAAPYASTLYPTVPAPSMPEIGACAFPPGVAAAVD